MAKISVDDDTVSVELGPLECVAGLNGTIAIDRDEIVAVERVDDARSRVSGTRWPGLYVPRVVTIGRFVSDGATDFAATYRSDAGYVITTRGTPFRRVIVSSETVPALDDLIDSPPGR